MDLGQQGVMQTVSNQSVISYWGRIKPDLKAVAVCIGDTEENILFVKFF